MRMEMFSIVYSQGRPMAGKSEESVAGRWSKSKSHHRDTEAQRKPAFTTIIVIPKARNERTLFPVRE
jgi:hypothetical protein